MRKQTLLLMSLMTIGLSGCGGGDDNDTSTGSPDEPSTTPSTYIVTATAAGGGAITPEQQTATEGQQITFTVTAEQGYRIIDVSGCGGALEGTLYTTSPINSNCAITASFQPARYQLTATASEGGSISPTSTSAGYNETLQFELTPAIGYQVDAVTGCNGILEGNTYTTGIIASDCHVDATFKELDNGSAASRYTDNGNGTITDSTTGLMWMRCLIGQTWQDGQCKGAAATYNWGVANQLVSQSAFSDGNYSDWRLPTIDELNSLVFCKSGLPRYWKTDFPAYEEVCRSDDDAPTIVRSAFPISSNAYWVWSATSTDGTYTQIGYRYAVSFLHGNTLSQYTPNNLYLLLVRDR